MQQDDFYNILTDDLPKSVNVNGVNYPVRTNFKDWILFFFLHEDVDLTDIEKITLSMDWYLDAVPTQKVAAYQALQKFAACDRMPKSKRKAAGVRRNVINLKRLLNGKQNVWKYQNGEEKSDSDGREKDV